MNTVEYFHEIPCDVFAVKRLMKNRFRSCHNLYRKTILGHYGCVNSLSFSNDGELFVSGGDDRRVLLWRTSQLYGVQNPTPTVMKTQHMENIFSTVFDCEKSRIFSAGKDEDVFLHDIESMDCVGMYHFDEPIYAVDSPFNNQFLFAAAGEDGTVQVIDVRTPTDRLKLAASCGSFHCAVFNPLEWQFLATANSKDGIALWDIRRPLKALKDFSRKNKNNSAMSVCFDYLGRKILGLLRKGGPVLYDIGTEQPPLYEFSDTNYRNVCTMKAACFFGEKDEYIASGSDDFNVYVWKIPDNDCEDKEVTTPHFMLQGHRSIVNQVRYDRNQHLMASAGVEKSIKIWSSFPMINSEGDVTNEEHFVQRERYTREQYTSLTLESGQMTHDYSSGSTDEDPQMLAMFDSLIERTKSDWASDTDSDSDNINGYTTLNLLLNPEDSSSSSDNGNESENNESSRAVGVSIEELRRIFRVNRRTPTSQGSSNSRTMVNLSRTRIMVNLSPLQEQQQNEYDQNDGDNDDSTDSSISLRTSNNYCVPSVGGGNLSSENITTTSSPPATENNTIPFHRRQLNKTCNSASTHSAINTASFSAAAAVAKESTSSQSTPSIPFHRRYQNENEQTETEKSFFNNICQMNTDTTIFNNGTTTNYSLTNSHSSTSNTTEMEQTIENTSASIAHDNNDDDIVECETITSRIPITPASASHQNLNDDVVNTEKENDSCTYDRI